MNNVESILKNILLFLLGVVIYIAGYNVYNNMPDSDSTSVEGEGPEESGGSL